MLKMSVGNRKIKVMYTVDHLGEGGIQDIIFDTVRLIDKSRFDSIVVALVSPHCEFSLESRILALNIPVVVLCRSYRALSKADAKYSLWAIFRKISFALILPYVFLRLLVAVYKEKPDIIHSFFLFAMPFSVVVAKLLNRPIVYSVPALKVQYDYYSRFAFIMLRVFSSYVEHFFTGLPPEDIMKPLRVRREKITCVPGVIDLSTTKHIVRSENILFDEYNLPEDAVVILGGGRFDYQKGHIYAIRVFERLQMLFPRLYLFIIGDGFLRSELLDYIRKEGLDSRVFLPGFRSDQHFFISLADVFLRTSFFEGSNMMLQRVMLHGKPIVAFNNGAPNEILQHDSTGLLVPFKDVDSMADAVSNLLRDRDKARALGRQAQDFLTTHVDIGKTVKAYQDSYVRYAQ